MFLDHERPRARNKYPRVEFIIVRITLSRNEINVFIRGVTDFRRFPTFTVLPIDRLSLCTFSSRLPSYINFKEFCNKKSGSIERSSEEVGNILLVVQMFEV